MFGDDQVGFSGARRFAIAQVFAMYHNDDIRVLRECVTFANIRNVWRAVPPGRVRLYHLSDSDNRYSKIFRHESQFMRDPKHLTPGSECRGCGSLKEVHRINYNETQVMLSREEAALISNAIKRFHLLANKQWCCGNLRPPLNKIGPLCARHVPRGHAKSCDLGLGAQQAANNLAS